MTDFFEALEALPEADFFSDLESYDPFGIKVGDKFTMYMKGGGMRLWEVVRVQENETQWDIMYVIAGSKPDAQGKYDVAGFINSRVLKSYLKAGEAKKK